MQKKSERPRAAKRTASEPMTPATPSLGPPPPAIYALRVWSVKKVNGKWYISQAARFDDKEQWRGPYENLHRATTAIARKMAEEVLTRHKRRCEYYDIID
jgi:hypothetical protein